MSHFRDRFALILNSKTYRPELPANPFTDQFTLEEIDFYDLPAPYDKDGVRVGVLNPRGNIEDYLNKNWRISDNWKVPALWIDGKMWMSLTPMEIQSAYVPITMANGVVGTAGLGLGYFPLRAASSPDVEEVHVYELNPKVIEFFKATFKDRPEMEKIQIHQGDVRKLALYDPRKKGPYFDFFWMDVYQTMLPMAVVDDITLFLDSVQIGPDTYRFWGQEKVVLDSLMEREHPKATELEKAFFKTWEKTPMNQDPDDDEDLGTLSEMYEPATDENYRRDTLVPLEVLPEDY